MMYILCLHSCLLLQQQQQLCMKTIHSWKKKKKKTRGSVWSFACLARVLPHCLYSPQSLSAVFEHQTQQGVYDMHAHTHIHIRIISREYVIHARHGNNITKQYYCCDYCWCCPCVHTAAAHTSSARYCILPFTFQCTLLVKPQVISVCIYLHVPRVSCHRRSSSRQTARWNRIFGVCVPLYNTSLQAAVNFLQLIYVRMHWLLLYIYIYLQKQRQQQ